MTITVQKVKTAVNDSQVVVFNLMISCISAERQLDLAKMGIDLDKLPSASRKLIQEKIFPKEFLNNYSRLRDRANAVLDKGPAVRVELGVVSSRTEAVKKISELDAIKADWQSQLDTDQNRYENICNERIALIAAQAFKEGVDAAVVNTLVDALSKRQPVWEEFVSRMRFEYSAMPVQLELDGNDQGFDAVLFQAQKDGLVALREGVFGSLVQHLVNESVQILKVLNDKKPKRGIYVVNYRTVARIGEITEKLHGLAFVHRSIAPLAKVIDDALRFMPKSVEKDLEMQPTQFFNLIACLEAMNDQHELLARLRDKQPLVTIHVEPEVQAPAQAAVVQPQGQVVTMQAPVATAPTASVESETESEAGEASEVEEVTQIVEVAVSEPVAEQPKVFDLPFMGGSLFD